MVFNTFNAVEAAKKKDRRRKEAKKRKREAINKRWTSNVNYIYDIRMTYKFRIG